MTPPRRAEFGTLAGVIRRLLPALVLLTACGTPSTADPKALLETWRDAMLRQASVRIDVESRAEGPTPSQTRWSGVLHTATTGFLGTTLDSDITVRGESQFGPHGYHVVKFDRGTETYVEHDRVRLPAGKKYVRFDFNQQVPWMWTLETEISIGTKDLHPSSLFVDLDDDTLRLVEASDDRYVLTSGQGVESNPSTASGVTLTVWVDDENRVTRTEQVSRDSSGQPHRKTTALSDWGTAPAVARPSPDVVADLTEATLSER